jgi:polyisoprenoid-binding protein YceI
MHSRRPLAYVLTVIFALLTAGSAAAQSAADAVGTWTFASSINEQNGRKTDTYGANATGMMVLDAQGHYSLIIIGANLPRYASNNRTTGTPEEYKAIASRSNAHFGAYAIDAANKTITFKIESATFPNWNGTRQTRTLMLKGDELQYAVAASGAGGSSVVTWRRAK